MDSINALKQAGGRVTVYDWLRVIATIFVVIGHSAYLNIQTTFGGVAYELPSNLNAAYNSSLLIGCRYLAGWVYSFHMPLFFMLSGAVLALKPIGDFDRVFEAKVHRLLIPYFIYGWLFMLPVKRIGGFYSNNSLKEALRGFLSGVDSGHLWFLIALFWCIIIFCILVKSLIKLNIQSIYAVLLIAGVIQLIGSYLPIDILGFKIGISYIFYFAIGYVFEIKRSSCMKWNTKKIVFAFGILIVLEILNCKFFLLNTFFAIIVGAFFTYILSDILDRIFKNVQKNKIWEYLVKNIFYVYIFHDPLEYIVLRIFMKNNLLALS